MSKHYVSHAFLTIAILCSVTPMISKAQERIITCTPDEVKNKGGQIWVRTASIAVEGTKKTLSFSSGATAAECAPSGHAAPWLTFRLMKNGKALTPFKNGEEAGVTDAQTATAHEVDVTSKFSNAYWNSADSCEIAMPGQAKC